jgi:alkanesulfonate monooxygenase SsuD/methylene tetrahydromethanopterin reductase-like flavin-dependent oxidoreductase (luciferase family)
LGQDEGTTTGTTDRRLGILGPADDHVGHAEGPAQALARICREVENAGAGAIWAIDHLFWARPVIECLATLAVAATATSRVPIGSCVLQLPLRQPGALAKQATTLQVLSGDRFVLGVGVGSHRGEFEAAGVDFGCRGRAMDAGLAALRAAWSTGHDDDLTYRQTPVTRPVPIWIGGSSAAARRRAARTGDGWVPLFLAPDRYEQDLSLLRHETEDAGRDPDDVYPAMVVMVHVGPEATALERGCRWLSSLYGIPPKAFAAHVVAGPAEHVAERLGAYCDAGAAHIVTMVADDDAVDHFGELMGTGIADSLQSAPGGRETFELEEVPA